MLAQKTEIGVKSVGTVITDLPRNNIQKLMYYLGCVNSCLRKGGNQLIESKHTNYKDEHKLSEDDRTVVVLLATILSPDELLDVCFFVVESGAKCLGGSSNEFLEITAANTVVGAAMSKGKVALFKGEKVQTAKIMVFTGVWLKNYFLDPFQGEVYRLKALQQKNTGKPACAKNTFVWISRD